MSSSDEASKQATLAKLAQSRADIRRVLEPPQRSPRRQEAGETGAGGAGDLGADVFPRSRTMRLLMTGRGIGTVGAVVGGFVIARPALAFKLLRILPTGAAARMLMVKAVSALRSKG